MKDLKNRPDFPVGDMCTTLTLLEYTLIGYLPTITFDMFTVKLDPWLGASMESR